MSLCFLDISGIIGIDQVRQPVRKLSYSAKMFYQKVAKVESFALLYSIWLDLTPWIHSNRIRTNNTTVTQVGKMRATLTNQFCPIPVPLFLTIEPWCMYTVHTHTLSPRDSHACVWLANSSPLTDHLLSLQYAWSSNEGRKETSLIHLSPHYEWGREGLPTP